MELEALAALPGYPWTAVVLVGLVAVAYLAKQIRTERPTRQSTTNARLGGRLERVERELRLEQIRRVQVEHELARSGFRLPAWPGDPALPAPRSLDNPDDDLDDDPEDDYPATEQSRMTIPPLPSFPRHSRSTR